PLDASAFNMDLTGQIGPMDVTQLNRFIGHVAPVEIKSGRLDSVAFDITVRNGFAQGSVVPMYDDLALGVTGKGASGVLGKQNLIGKVARAVAEVAVNEFALRRANPDGDQMPRAGRVTHAFSPDETLPAFLWNGIRDGLMEVVKKKGRNDRNAASAN